MDFALTDDQQMMRDSLRRYLADQPAPDWSSLCELGVMAALLPQDHGGIGGTGRDIALVFEELGRAFVNSPALSCAMVSVCPSLADNLLAGHVIAPALFEASGRYDHLVCEATIIRQDNDDKVAGKKTNVPDAGMASSFLVSTMNKNELVLAHVAAGDPGVTLQSSTTIDDRQTGILNLDGANAVIVDANPDHLFATGLLALGAEALGMMDVVRDMTVSYLKQRKQFGKALSEFQVLQHRLADMAMAIEQVRSSVINAAAAHDQAGGVLTAEVHALKQQAGEVGRLVAEEAIQLHGGIGMTAEYDLGKYAKRLIMLDHVLGDADWHLMKFITLTSKEAAA